MNLVNVRFTYVRYNARLLRLTSQPTTKRNSDDFVCLIIKNVVTFLSKFFTILSSPSWAFTLVSYCISVVVF